ncbi:MAG: aspartate aminotransferase family protein [Gemmatimonadales bacterium]
MTNRYPETPVFYRKLNRSYPRVVRGEGCYLFDENGKRYLDGSGGAYVANLGHGVAEVADAVAEQIRRVAYVSGAAFTNDAVEELAALLVPLVPGDLDKFYFLNSGSDANEAALKLARQYWVETGKPGKHKIIALKPAYHGNTMLALSVSAREHYRTLYREWLVPVVQMPGPYPYRCDCEGAADCPRCTGRLLEEVIAREGADSIAALIGETVGGSSTGASVPRPEYWRTIREICSRHGILWIADEVLCGAGRTGTWTAVEQYGAVPDLLVMGKGLSGGYAPLAAVAAPERILDPIARRSGAFNHAQTFSHAPMACAAGVAAVRYLVGHDLIGRCRETGKRFQEALRPLGSLGAVGDVRGRGLLAGIEFVADKATKAPFPRSLKYAERFTDLAQDLGLIVWPNVGHADGSNGDLVCLAPPFAIGDAEIAELVSLFEATHERMAAEIPSGAAT